MNSPKESNPILGEIYLVKFDGIGSEQRGTRPALIIQNNTGNKFSPNVIVLPLTSSKTKARLPTHVDIPASVGLRFDSVVLCESPVRISKERLGVFLTSLPEIYLRRVAEAFVLATSIISYIGASRLEELREQAVRFNSM